MPKPEPSWPVMPTLPLAQVMTKSPAGSAATLGAYWSPAVYVLTANSPRGIGRGVGGFGAAAGFVVGGNPAGAGGRPVRGEPPRVHANPAGGILVVAFPRDDEIAVGVHRDGRIFLVVGGRRVHCQLA